MKKEVTSVEVVAGVVIQKEGKYLLVQEKQSKVYGLWNFPAGRVDVGESIEQAAVREAKEETGYDVELLEEIAIFHESIDVPVKHAFEAEIVGGALHFPEEELLDARWFSYEEMVAMKEVLRSPWILGAIKILEEKL